MCQTQPDLYSAWKDSGLHCIRIFEHWRILDQKVRLRRGSKGHMRRKIIDAIDEDALAQAFIRADVWKTKWGLTCMSH
jgi:hypothetical protein